MASLSQHLYMKPIIGPIEERPEFVSLIEWAMLKAVAHNHDDPVHELTRLVNFLRFSKQLEIWQAMTASADQAHRAELATGLLTELAQHVANGDLDAAEADRIQTSLQSGQ